MKKALIGLSKPIRYPIESFLYRVSDQGRHLSDLKDRYKGRPMLIVGNGPSLNQTPLEKFAHIPSIGMNKIDLLFSRSDWRPTMILCVNNVVVQQHRDSFLTSEIPVYLAWKSRWFVRGKSQSVRYFNLFDSEEFSMDLPAGVGSGATVTYPALQFAYYMGADPVIVVGVDHNFDRSGGSNIYEKRIGDDVNHFDPNYFASGMTWGVPNLDASEEVFLRSRLAFEADGRKIYDATIGGKLQIFEKIEIKDAIKLVSKDLTGEEAN
ncbi:6-hydroxymethylpterin diphosphokinase MptE-like protein [Altererythrobacter sp.]|uniref:6-hydroxymethylpterin diphosphokinase MptE-like protein n=1 Tax=Altererythrobacter sp. TaxID=1872480 RepID=UPI001AFDB27F|nr:6-hydroxymethylpterin diphosphokinase MptE-like protein [Altererythrobacter sp.]MBO6609853.1 hypothetical protein [Altererythrobacter sp.]MBO6642209.1 hypothetical protein [Altererythrobacter sp.]MBO6709283.1 hypothetical protein [Altererythrobacter sp.]